MLSSVTNPHQYHLDKKYYDDFTIDLGWTVSGSATSGIWERGIPEGTTYSSTLANPDSDVNADCYDKAYVTGNAGGSAGSDDVDGGYTILTSPIIDLSAYTNPYLNYYRWFFNDGGSGTPNDSLVISMSNGLDTAVLDRVGSGDPDPSTWVFTSIRLLDYMSLSDTMQLIVEATDFDGGHIVEAGFDQFEIIDMPTGLEGEQLNRKFLIYPNPFNDVLNIKVREEYTALKVQVFDITGQLIELQNIDNQSIVKIKNSYPKGVYFIHVYGDGALITTQKVVKF